ncbi:MAG TPA: class I SAM-dependent methyltransferase [Terriglobia bacterium]|nr:class I SAM-dependent methyltransferase [Terriglobia bacterium]
MKGDNVQAHSTEGDSWTRWAHEIRKLEFEGMMEGVPLNRDSTVLELGCGDGFQLSLLRERFTRVFAIDPVNRPDQASGCAYAVAEALPFADGTFDLIVSNCVLEHLNDRGRALNESVRVLKPGGYMAHVVPSRFWKIANLLLNPIGYPLRVAEKWCATRAVVRGGISSPFGRPTSSRPNLGQVFSRWACPPIHGTYPGHISELQAYGRRHWAESFTHVQLVPLSDRPLICSTQFGFLRFRFIPARTWLGRHGLDSSRVFVMQKVSL